MSIWTLMLAMIGALILGVAAVAIDRLNFPQRPFRAEKLPEERLVPRDRTGAHVIEDELYE